VIEFSLARAGMTKVLSKFSKSAFYGRFSMLRYYKDYPEPKLPSDEWVKLRTRLCGICGSDVRIITLSESFYLYPFTSFPFIPGHEVVATVEEVGREVDDLRPGDRVVVDPALPCRVRGFEECEACERGHPAACHNTDRGKVSPGIFVGTCRDVGGGWSEYLVAHKSQLFKCEDIPDENAVFAEPLSIGIHSALRAFPKDDQVVAVVGCGMIGIATIVALRSLGFKGEIVGIERSKRQAEVARRFGANNVITDDPIEEFASLIGGRVHKPPVGKKVLAGGGADVVFECVGTGDAVETALRIAKPLGRVVIAGTVAGVSIDLAPIFAKELEVLGTFGCGYEVLDGERRRTFDIALEILRRRDLSPLLTHVFALEEYKKALWAAIDKKRSGAIKVAFKI
jgi:threonine dehydrogenase-like Zn-dependent dehydrogenase